MGHLLIIKILLNAFTEFNVKYDEEFSAYFKTQENEKSGSLTHFYIFYRFYERLLRANSEIFVLDSIYKINRYKMPLVNIVGIIPCNKSFFAGSAFLPSKKILDYEWIFVRVYR
jgi:hypothetical protein